MDWNVLYSNVTPPTWEQITESVSYTHLLQLVTQEKIIPNYFD